MSTREFRDSVLGEGEQKPTPEELEKLRNQIRNIVGVQLTESQIVLEVCAEHDGYFDAFAALAKKVFTSLVNVGFTRDEALQVVASQDMFSVSENEDESN